MIEPSVLVVDDEVQFVETLVKRLDKRGVKVNSLLQPEIEIGVVPFGSLFPIPMAATSIPAY